MSARPRRVAAGDYRVAYDYRARYFSDPAMMTGRDAPLTRFKVANVAARLPLTASSRVLDIGPGDGTLFQLIADRVTACIGVDPSEHAVSKLSSAFAGRPNVSFVIGSSTELPDFDDTFDIIVINSVMHMLSGHEEVVATLQSIATVCAADAVVFVGEMPFRGERADGLVKQLRTQIGHVGPRRAARAVFDMYLRPVLRGEPLLTEPIGRTLAYTAEEFTAVARDVGFQAEQLPHPEPRGASTTRYDYLLKPVPRSPRSSADD